MSLSGRVGVLVGVIVMLAASIGVVVAGPASAETVSITVTSNIDEGGSCPSATDCTFRQALTDASSAGPNGDADVTVTFAPGLDPIQLVSTLDYDGGVGGAHVLTLIGNGVTLSGNRTFALLVNYTTSSFLIEGMNFTDGGGGTGGAIVTPNALSSLVVSNSNFSDNHVTVAGGAVYAIGSIEFSNVTFTNNTANDGGAVHSSESAVFTDSTFSGNSASRFGGAVFYLGDVTLSKTTFADNSADFVGGAILGSGPASINESTFSGNGADGGGGAIAITGAVAVTDSDFHGNSTGGAAGALYVGGTSSISGSRFSDNTAGEVAGAFLSADDSTVVDSAFIDNASNDDGGALTANGSLHLENSTLAGNTSVHGEGAFWANGVATIVNSTLVANIGGGLASTVSAEDLVLVYSTITDVHVADGQIALEARSNRISTFASVIAGAEGLSGGMLCNVAATSFGYNVSTDSSCGLTETGDIQDATIGSIDLGPLFDNDGLAPTQLPRIASPLVAAIPNVACATGPAAAVMTDQRGYARPNVVGGPCDIGAVQLTPAVSATVTESIVTVEVREFTSAATVTLYSDPVLLGTIAVDATGFGQATFPLPTSVMCGVHEVVATASEGQIASTQLLIDGCIAPVFTG